MAPRQLLCAGPSPVSGVGWRGGRERSPTWPFCGLFPGASLHTSRAPTAHAEGPLVGSGKYIKTGLSFQWTAALDCSQPPLNLWRTFQKWASISSGSSLRPPGWGAAPLKPLGWGSGPECPGRTPLNPGNSRRDPGGHACPEGRPHPPRRPHVPLNRSSTWTAGASPRRP